MSSTRRHGSALQKCSTSHGWMLSVAQMLHHAKIGCFLSLCCIMPRHWQAAHAMKRMSAPEFYLT